MKAINSKKMLRVVKVLVLVVAPWFTTGCAGLQAILPLITGLASKLGSTATTPGVATGATGVVRPPAAPAPSAQVPIGQSRQLATASIRATDSRDTLPRTRVL